MQEYYDGPLIEKGSSAITRDVSPTIKWLYKNNYFQKGQKILDVGAGKNGRNAEFLRDMGCKVYTYDPYHFNTSSKGFKKGNISFVWPSEHFDIAFSCYVLNIVPKYEEDNILSRMVYIADYTFNIVRDTDIIDTVSKALLKSKGYIWESFKKSPYTEITDETIYQFCKYGVQTDRNKFQRFVEISKPFKLIRHLDNKFRIYMSEQSF